MTQNEQIIDSQLRKLVKNIDDKDPEIYDDYDGHYTFRYLMNEEDVREGLISTSIYIKIPAYVVNTKRSEETQRLLVDAIYRELYFNAKK